MMSITLYLKQRLGKQTRYIFVFSMELSRSMGRKANKRKRTTKSISREHFPVGELARNRKQIQAEYLSKCQVLQSEKKKLQKATDKVPAKIIVCFLRSIFDVAMFGVQPYSLFA